MSVDNAASITADSDLFRSVDGFGSDWPGADGSVDLLDRTQPRIYVRGNTPSASARDRLGLVEFHLLRSGLTRTAYRPIDTEHQDTGVVELPPLVPLVVGDSRVHTARPSRWTVTPGVADLSLADAHEATCVPATDQNRTTAPAVRQPAVAVVTRRAVGARLTGRGQVAVVFLLGILVAVVAGFTNAANADRSTPPLTGATEVVVTVQPGDTLYSIALETVPRLDPQVVVASIKRVNGLTSAEVTNLQPGQILAVPTS